MKFYSVLSLFMLLGLLSVQSGHAQFGGGASIGFFRTNHFWGYDNNIVVGIMGDYSFSDKWTVEIGESFVHSFGSEMVVTGWANDTTVSPSVINIKSRVKIPQFIIYARVCRYFGKNKSWFGSAGTDFVSQISKVSVGKYDGEQYVIYPDPESKKAYFHYNLKLSVGKDFKIGKVNLFAETRLGIPFVNIKNTLDEARGIQTNLIYPNNRYWSVNIGVRI